MSAAIRVARAADAAAIADLVERAFQPYVPRIGLRPKPMDADYTAPIERGEAHVTGDPVNGVVVLRLEPDHAFLDVIALEPDAQGQGRGRELIGFAEQRTRDLGLGELRLLTHELMTENRGFYAHLGYEEYDRRADARFARVFLRKRLF